MLISDKWTDYELLDCSDGERLERWGQYTLVRPDPQVIWQTPKEHPGWGYPDARYERSQTGGGSWNIRGQGSRKGAGSREQGQRAADAQDLGARGQDLVRTGDARERGATENVPKAHGEQGTRVAGKLPDKWRVAYGELAFNVSLMNFKHTGVFPEQAVNWDRITDAISLAERKVSVLNLFAYTGGATLAAAAAGADVCHVDAARGMVARARENAQSSGLAEKPVRWIVDDCAKFVQREINRGRRYDVLMMDPPSYGRGPSGEVWKLEDDLYAFLKLCSGVLSDTPLFVLINSYTTGLSPSTMSYMVQSLLGGQAASDELGLPVTSSGASLPCGASCWWERSAGA